MKKINFKFPKIYRFITDSLAGVSRFFNSLSLGRRAIIFFISFLSLIFALTLITISSDAYKNILEERKIEQERGEISRKIQYWESIATKYQGYRDAYFQLAVLEYKLRDFEKSMSYLKKVLEIDPNFQEGRKLEKLIEKNY